MTIWKREFIPQKSPMQKSSILRTQGFYLVISSRVLFEQNTSLGGCIIFKANPIPWSNLFWLLAGICTFFLSFGKWARCKMTLNRSVYPQWARSKPKQTWCLTPWPLGDFKYNYRQVIFKLTLVKLSSDECHWTLLMIIQHWFRQWLGAVRQQAITWANVDPDLCRQMASLGLGMLAHFSYTELLVSSAIYVRVTHWYERIIMLYYWKWLQIFVTLCE